MKKLLAIICIALLCTLMASAAETVIYENDFSNPATLNDFEQYRQEWEIKDGGLYLTENFLRGAKNTSLDTSFAHIIYQSKETLTDYIVEVDYMNVQTAGGIIFRADQTLADQQDAGFYGYLAFLANDANKGALGCGAKDGAYKGNIDVGKGGLCNISNNVHIKVIVKGNKIHTTMTNIDSGKVFYDFEYTIGTNQYDDLWASGTFGLRMRAGMKANNAYSAGIAYFDNLKVTTANEVDLGGTGDIPDTPALTGTIAFDTTNVTPVYTNTFDNALAIKDFEQFRGNWSVFDGKLYLSNATTGIQSYIIYAGNEELMNLTDYVVDVDLYNVQTQGGVLLRCDFANITGETDDGFMGYQAFVSNDGKKGALGAGQPNGKWLEGNIEVSPNVFTPGSNLHLQFAVKGKMLQYIITDIETGKVIWQWSEEHDMWSKGTFGFRFRSNEHSGMSNLGTAAFDNLVVSVFNEEEVVPPATEEPTPEPTPEPAKTVVKMTIGSTTAYINDEAQTLDAPPINRNNRTMLPVRFLANALGVPNEGIKWDAATRTATLKNETTTIMIIIDAYVMFVNGEAVTLDSPAIIESNRTYLPVRAIANALGVSNDNIMWDGATSTATLIK